MAGYYYSNPTVGASINNLSKAIFGDPMGEVKAGILGEERRQAEIDTQAARQEASDLAAMKWALMGEPGEPGYQTAYALAAGLGPDYMERMPEFSRGMEGALAGGRVADGSVPVEAAHESFDFFDRGAGQSYPNTYHGSNAKLENALGLEAMRQGGMNQREEMQIDAGRYDPKPSGGSSRGGGGSVSPEEQARVSLNNILGGVEPTTSIYSAMLADIQRLIDGGYAPDEAAGIVGQNFQADGESWFADDVYEGYDQNAYPPRAGQAPAAAPAPAPSVADAAKGGQQASQPVEVTSAADLPPAEARVAGQTRIVKDGQVYVWNGEGWVAE